jgi:5'-nucleotidase / UDP-sugar diphosphatase
LILFTLTGRELFEFIQDNALRVDLPGEPHQERGFQHFSKDIRYRIARHTNRPQVKAVDILVKGLPIEQCFEMKYRLAAITFFRGLARTWEEQTNPIMKLLVFHPKQSGGVDSGLFMHDLLLEHIRSRDGIDPEGGALRDGRLEIF